MTPIRKARGGEGAISGDPRFESRRREVAKLRKRRVITSVGAVAALGLAGGGGFWLLKASPFTAITQIAVHVSGAQLSSQSVTQVADRFLNRNYFSFDQAELVRALQSNPLVGPIRVRRSFPHSLSVSVTQAVPAFVVRTGGASSGDVAINSRLQAMPSVPTSPTAAPTCIASLPFSGAAGDFTCAATSPLSAIAPELRRISDLRNAMATLQIGVSSAYVFAGYGLGFQTASGAYLYFSDASPDTPALASLALLQKGGQVVSGAVVDLSNPAHPAIAP